MIPALYVPYAQLLRDDRCPICTQPLKVSSYALDGGTLAEHCVVCEPCQLHKEFAYGGYSYGVKDRQVPAHYSQPYEEQEAAYQTWLSWIHEAARARQQPQGVA